jgi:hypothetical protein
VESGYTEQDIVAMIDGSQDPYTEAGCKGFARQYYVKGNVTMDLRIWEMNDPAAAKKMYDKNKGELPSEGITGEDIGCLYDAGVIGNDSLMWKGYVQKSQYMFRVYSKCKSKAEVAALKTEAIAFARALADKLP